jgi:hypothetical protein
MSCQRLPILLRRYPGFLLHTGSKRVGAGRFRQILAVSLEPVTSFCYWDTTKSYSTARVFSTKPNSKEESIFSTQRVKIIIKQYGPVAVVFHTAISLCSLGGFYLLVKSGLDVPLLLSKVGITLSETSTGLSTFGIAYLCHKVFMPLRCFVTISCVPLIVRFFRRQGWMKSGSQDTA